jgi:hypothetical protein
LATYVLKGPALSYRIYHYYPSSSFVVGLSHIFEPLLPCSVPDLKFDPFVSKSDGFDFKINSDGGDVILLEGVFAKTD